MLTNALEKESLEYEFVKEYCTGTNFLDFSLLNLCGILGIHKMNSNLYDEMKFKYNKYIIY